MNAWNAHNAMSANKNGSGIRGSRFGEFFSESLSLNSNTLILAALFLCPSLAHAQGSAPGMFGVREVVVQYVRFSNPKAADGCGLTREDISTALNKALLDSNVPAISIANAKPPMMGVARIELVPEVSTVNSETLDCTSWVSLTAQSQNNILIPPVDTMRNVTVIYWHKGIMAATNQSTHSNTIDDIFKKMAEDFGQQYRIDQPPKLPTQ